MLQAITNKLCPFRSTLEKPANCVRECQLCINGNCALASFSKIQKDIETLNNTIDELGIVLNRIRNGN